MIHLRESTDNLLNKFQLTRENEVCGIQLVFRIADTLWRNYEDIPYYNRKLTLYDFTSLIYSYKIGGTMITVLNSGFWGNRFIIYAWSLESLSRHEQAYSILVHQGVY
jgi:hypothetical protein